MRLRSPRWINAYRGEQGILLPVLLDINRYFNWLPRCALEHVSSELSIPLTEILRVASFYNAFSLVPRGKHIISVCLGTGCFVKGSTRILERLERELGISHGPTTEDALFSLEVVRCIGCCALAPAGRRVGEDRPSAALPLPWFPRSLSPMWNHTAKWKKRRRRRRHEDNHSRRINCSRLKTRAWP